MIWNMSIVFYSTYTHFLCTTHSLKTNHVIVMIASLLPQLNMRWEKYFGNNYYVHHTLFSTCLEINDLLYQAWFFSAVSLFAALNFPSINPILLETSSCSTFLSKVWLILNFVNFFQRYCKLGNQFRVYPYRLLRWWTPMTSM